MPNQAFTNSDSVQHAALWFIGPDMPGLLRLGAKFVADHSGNIDKDIADKFGEKAVVFMSITAAPPDIAQMAEDIGDLKKASRCGVVFQPMHEPTVPEGFREHLYGFDVVTDDAVGIIADLTELVTDFDMMILGHTGERRILPGPVPKVRSGQKYVVMVPHEFDRIGFTNALTALVKKHDGIVKTPLRTVPGLLWWW